MALRRKTDSLGTPEDEREALRRQRLEGARELELLKRELGERIAAVRQREQELEAALGQAAPGTALSPIRPSRPDPLVDRELSARASAVERRERELAARERDLAERERAFRENPPDPSAERLAQIEARLAELGEAEKLFLRTQQELAARSDALSARERLVAELERETGQRAEHWDAPELAELERRLRRLESERSAPAETTQTFSGGFSKMRRSRTASTSTAPSPLPPAQP